MDQATSPENIMFWVLNSGTALCCAQAVAVECGFYASYDLLSIQLVKLISIQKIQKKLFISTLVNLILKA